MHSRGQCIAKPAQDCRSLYMGLAELLKAGWRNPLIFFMERIFLFAMGRTAKSRMAECIYLFIGGTYLIFNWRKLVLSLLEEPL